jgi:hypothetical protein
MLYKMDTSVKAGEGGHLTKWSAEAGTVELMQSWGSTHLRGKKRE